MVAGGNVDSAGASLRQVRECFMRYLWCKRVILHRRSTNLIEMLHMLLDFPRSIWDANIVYQQSLLGVLF